MAVGGLILGIIAVFIPPLVVFWRRGCSAALLINIGLLFLGWIPGVLHAWFIILDSPNMRQRHRMKQEQRPRTIEVPASRKGRSPMRMSQGSGSVVEERYVRRRSGGGHYNEEAYNAPPSYYASTGRHRRMY